jgi:hypothetical protein
VVAGCTLITRLAERGIDPKAIAEIAGHSRILQDVTWRAPADLRAGYGPTTHFYAVKVGTR